MIYAVEGRKFEDRSQAIAFANGLAEKQDRSVDVMIEVEVVKSETKRSWICRMHPPGYRSTLLRKTAPIAATPAQESNNA
jgi:hypothetical protein